VDYQRIYNEIIERRKHQEPEGYSEKHHIVPRSFGGANNSENLVRLTAREHFICHWLLTKIYPSGQKHYKMIHAFVAMAWWHSENQERYRCTSRLYERLKKEHAAVVSKMTSVSQKGSKNSQYGKIWIWHELIGSKKIPYDLLPEYYDQGWYKGRNVRFENMIPVEVVKSIRQKNMLTNRENSNSPEARLKMRNAKLGKRRIHNKVECPHCKKVGGANIMSRWHFNNCADIVQR